MPRTHPRHKKRDVLKLLALDLPIHVIQDRTGIPQRTLYRWKKHMLKKQQRRMAKKTSAFMAKSSQNSDLCHKNPDPGQNMSPEDDRLPQNNPAEPQDSNSAASNEEDLKFIRAQLMDVVRDIAAALNHSSPDLNSHSLALSRLLDRIRWLDQLIEREESELLSDPGAEAANHDFPGWLRPALHRTEEQLAAEEAEIARRRAWAKSQIGDGEFWGLN